MASLNQTQLIGNVGGDPTVKVFESKSKKVTFSVATTEKRKDKDGNKIDVTDWHNVVCWGKLADIVESYVKKGKSIFVQGKSKQDVYDGENGEKKYYNYILASTILLLDSKFSEDKKVQESIVSDDSADDLPF